MELAKLVILVMYGRRQRSNSYRRVVGEQDGDPANLPRTPEGESSPNKLPVETSSFVGRQRELAEAHDLLAGTRLLTLSGAEGSGKSGVGGVYGNVREMVELPE